MSSSTLTSILGMLKSGEVDKAISFIESYQQKNSYDTIKSGKIVIEKRKDMEEQILSESSENYPIIASECESIADAIINGDERLLVSSANKFIAYAYYLRLLSNDIAYKTLEKDYLAEYYKENIRKFSVLSRTSKADRFLIKELQSKELMD